MIRIIGYSIGLFIGVLFILLSDVKAQTNSPLTPLLRTVDVDIGEAKKVELHDGSTAEVKLLSVESLKDPVMDAVRGVEVTVYVNEEKTTIQSGPYHLPVTVGQVQIDSPVTLDYSDRTHFDWWGLEKDVRLRLWPAGSPFIWPGTFVYPVNQKWLASLTQYSNEPVLGSPRANGEIYYHAGIDLGGAEDMVEIYTATDGVVVSARGEVLSGEPDEPINPRYDVVYIRDARGWYYRYSHFDSISPDLQVGQSVQAGQKLGMLGKEGGSGGWTHLHFHIMSRQPSGKWGMQEGYAFLWEAYRRQYDPDVLAVARPHKVLYAGDTATLSASNSWSKHEIQSYEWTLSNGERETGKEVEQTYESPGMYSEIVKVSDNEGNYDYDFATVLVFEEGSNGENRPPRIHSAYYPTRDISPRDKVFFQVRSQGVTEGYDIWDFDDGSDPVKVKSNIDTDNRARNGYATISHRYEEAGDYLVRVTRETSKGSATSHLHVRVRNK